LAKQPFARKPVNPYWAWRGCSPAVLATRVSGLAFMALKFNDYADLCRAMLGQTRDATIWTADLRDFPSDLRAPDFDHVAG
jgi:hypothetical protein